MRKSSHEFICGRQSCFELLRLISMFFIILYHLLLWFVQDNPSHVVLKALWLPLHVGVICFVLISGLINKLLSPVWNISNVLNNLAYKRLGF